MHTRRASFAHAWAAINAAARQPILEPKRLERDSFADCGPCTILTDASALQSASPKLLTRLLRFAPSDAQASCIKPDWLKRSPI